MAGLQARDPDWTLEETDLIDWGWILLADGRCSDAAGVLRAGVLLHPESAATLDAQAETRWLLGDTQGARAL